MRKRPSLVILHVGTNDAVNSDPSAIVNQLINLKEYIESELPDSMVISTNKFLSTLLCVFRNGHNSQHALFRLIETCRKILDERGVVGMVQMDLSKAYDCFPHDLLIAKLAVYGFGPNSLALISNNLSQMKQRIKVGSKFIEWQEMASGVPQGSVLGPLLFNIFVNDFILAIKSSYVCNVADDNTMYVCDKDVESVATRLEDDASRALDWFKSNNGG